MPLLLASRPFFNEALSKTAVPHVSSPSRSPPFRQCHDLATKVRFSKRMVWETPLFLVFFARGKVVSHPAVKGQWIEDIEGKIWEDGVLGPLVSGRWIFWLHDLIKARLSSSIDLLDVKLTQPGSSKRSN